MLSIIFLLFVRSERSVGHNVFHIPASSEAYTVVLLARTYIPIRIWFIHFFISYYECLMQGMGSLIVPIIIDSVENVNYIEAQYGYYPTVAIIFIVLSPLKTICNDSTQIVIYKPLCYIKYRTMTTSMESKEKKAYRKFFNFSSTILQFFGHIDSGPKNEGQCARVLSLHIQEL